MKPPSFLPSILPAALGLLAVGCYPPPYQSPSAYEPHAFVKLRRSYGATAGVSLREAIIIDDHMAYDKVVPVQAARDARTAAVLVHPIPATIEVQSDFFHQEQRLVSESYTVRTPYTTTESYSCGSGFGRNASYRTCTRTVTHHRSETRWRTVFRPVHVSDAACKTAIRFRPRMNHIYQLDYAYQDRNVCSVSCVEQVPIDGGKFSEKPCALLPLEKKE
ncbi:hypothetical protein [Polyangium aurulentum]|uniref:hypothetical protein n=1 Tax=Polyangium aurulentum TaxID=2567896 RepID=UPI0010AE1C62|nr:hypothetical protein [Polyangium aurulentum]UQA57512.1 hypothetical protein E8A73_040550 [Polyangium aurulentum]